MITEQYQSIIIHIVHSYTVDKKKLNYAPQLSSRMTLIEFDL